MRTLRDLLTTWENWSARETTRRALAKATTDTQRETLARILDADAEVGPLDALRDATELVNLLSGWRWHAVYAARVEGAAWWQIGEATGATPEQARAGYLETLEWIQDTGLTDTAPYRDAR